MSNDIELSNLDCLFLQELECLIGAEKFRSKLYGNPIDRQSILDYIQRHQHSDHYQTTMKAEHTPTPWQSDDCPDANGFTTIRISDGTDNGNTDEEPIATVYNDQDAALIVRAVNAHDALVDALRDAYTMIWMHTPEINKSGTNPNDTINKIKAAIKQATEIK